MYMHMQTFSSFKYSRRTQKEIHSILDHVAYTLNLIIIIIIIKIFSKYIFKIDEYLTLDFSTHLNRAYFSRND